MVSIELKNLDESSADITSEDINNSGEISNSGDITSESTYNESENVCVNINTNTDKKQDVREYHVKKVGGGGPDEPKFIPMIITIISFSFFTILNDCIATIMYSDLVKDFDKELTTIQWVTTGFVLILAIGMVFSSYIAKHLHMRTIFFTSVSLFVGGSLICVLANSFVLLLIGRIIQAFGTALLRPQISNIIIIMAPRGRIGFYHGVSMVIIITGSAIGPTLSGLITKYLGWRFVFAFLIPIPLISGIIGYWTVGNIIEQDDTNLDILSVILAILGYGGISYGLGSIGDYGFGSPLVISTIVVGAISLVGFFFWEYYCKNPIVSLKGLGSSVFIVNVLLSNIVSSSLGGWLAILPFIIQNYLGKSSFVSGLALLPGGIVNALLNIVGGKIYDRYYFKYGSSGIFLLLMGSTFFFVMHVTDQIKLWVIIVGYIIGNVGVPIVACLYTPASLTCVPPQSTPHAAALFHSFYQLFSALYSAVYITLLNNFDSVSFVSSKEPLINGGAVCFLFSIVIFGLTLIISILWSIYYFKDHDVKGNLKQ
jgi:DHA2 family lincomycin resistance protein-like MFS transporter